MKWINFFFNPSKRVRHLLNPKQHDDPSYILKKRLAKLKIKEANHLKLTSYFSVFSKFFLLLSLTLVVGFRIYFKIKNISLDEIAEFIYNLHIPILSFEFGPSGCDKIKNVQSFLFLGSIYCFFLGAVFWVIGFYRRLSILPLATFILAITTGIFFGIQFFLFDSVFVNLTLRYILHVLFWIPFLTTIFVLGSVSWLYYFKKIYLSEKKANLVIALFFSFHFIVIAFIICYHLMKSNYWILMVTSLFLAISDILLSTLMWVVTLQQLDQFIEQKRPRKHQWILISILFLAAIRIFVTTLYIVLVIIKIMKLTKK